MKVREAMSENPVVLKQKSNVFDALGKMKSKSIDTILVADVDEPIGILTRNDILTRVVALRKNLKTTQLQEVMSQPVISIQEDLETVDAAELMRN